MVKQRVDLFDVGQGIGRKLPNVHIKSRHDSINVKYYFMKVAGQEIKNVKNLHVFINNSSLVLNCKFECRIYSY